MTTINFSNFVWTVKVAQATQIDPGPNWFSDTSQFVQVDGAGNLLLTIDQDAANGNRWTCAEIFTGGSGGYGTYEIELGTDLSSIDTNIFFDFTTFSNEIDFDHRRIATRLYGTKGTFEIGTDPINSSTFTQSAGTGTKWRFIWEPDGVTWQLLNSSGTILNTSFKSDDLVPPPEAENVHLALWLFGGLAPTNGLPLTVQVNRFTYIPLGEESRLHEFDLESWTRFTNNDYRANEQSFFYGGHNRTSGGR